MEETVFLDCLQILSELETYPNTDYEVTFFKLTLVHVSGNLQSVKGKILALLYLNNKRQVM